MFKLIRNEKVFAGTVIDEEGHMAAIWVSDNDAKVRIFATRAAANRAAKHFGGKAVKAD